MTKLKLNEVRRETWIAGPEDLTIGRYGAEAVRGLDLAVAPPDWWSPANKGGPRNIRNRHLYQTESETSRSPRRCAMYLYQLFRSSMSMGNDPLLSLFKNFT